MRYFLLRFLHFLNNMYYLINSLMDMTKLYVASCYAAPGPILKRIRPRDHGRAFRVLKRTSHITIVLKEKD